MSGEIYRVKFTTSAFQFLPETGFPEPKKGTGGQANFIYIQREDLDFFRSLNALVIQHMAIQPSNRSIFIIDPKDPKAKVREAWRHVTSVKWPIIVAQGGWVEVLERSNGFGRINTIPVNADFSKYSYELTPTLVHHMRFGPKHSEFFRFRHCSMPIFDPFGRKGKGQTGIWIRMNHLEIP